MFPEKVLTLLELDGVVAARITPRFANHNAWVAVYRFKVDPFKFDHVRDLPKQREGELSWKYRVRCFELPAHLDYNNFDVSDEYYVVNVHQDVETIEDAERIVRDWLDDLNQLDEMRRCDFPE